MRTTPINPSSGIYAATEDYVHAMEVVGAQRLLFVSGTMGLDESGHPPATLEECEIRSKADTDYGGRRTLAW